MKQKAKEKKLPDYTNVNGVINTKKLLDLLSNVRQSDRIKSKSTPLELNTTLYPDSLILETAIQSFDSAAEQMKVYSPECYYIYELLKNSGCRISEILSIRAVDIMKNGMVRIAGKKKSSDRIITVGNAIEYIMRCKKFGVKPFQDINRKFVWTVFKKFGIQLTVGSSGKKAVTHSLRHIVVASAKNQNIDNNTTGSFIGHKNKNNTERYGKIKG